VISVVLWKWGRKYENDHLVRMQSMLSRHLKRKHRIVCLRDQPRGVPDGIVGVPLPPTFPGSAMKCMRRLWIYSPKAASLGDRLLQLDLDMVLTDSIEPLVDRPEPFVIWKSDSNVVHGYGYNPSVILMTPGARADLWNTFCDNPQRVMAEADAAGWWVKVNSDQAVMSYLLAGQDVPCWTAEDGIVAYRIIAGKHGQRGKTLPAGVRMVSFHGPRDPSSSELQEKSPWLAEHWR